MPILNVSERFVLAMMDGEWYVVDMCRPGDAHCLILVVFAASYLNWATSIFYSSSSSSFSLLEVDKRNPLQNIKKFMINNIQRAVIKSKIEHIIQWFECQYKSV